jgi:hypothetical protein
MSQDSVFNHLKKRKVPLSIPQIKKELNLGSTVVRSINQLEKFKEVNFYVAEEKRNFSRHQLRYYYIPGVTKIPKQNFIKFRKLKE